MYQRLAWLTLITAVSVGGAAMDCFGQSTGGQLPADWDLYMLRLVNRARTDPAGENLRQGTSYSATAAAPLAYDLLVGRAAQNHNEWMGNNRANAAIDNPLNSGPAPDSFSHYETLNAQSGGTAATSTPGFSGANIGTRLNYVNYAWSSAGENILWRSNTPAINAALIESNHAGWWNSDGHRSNMMNANFTSFGHSIANIGQNFATQNFSRPLSGAQKYLFGLLYQDFDGNSQWTPRADTDPAREGLGNLPFTVYPHGGTTAVATGTTFANGGYSVRLANGSYDLQFNSTSLPGGLLRIENVCDRRGECRCGRSPAVATPHADVEQGRQRQLDGIELLVERPRPLSRANARQQRERRAEYELSSDLKRRGHGEFANGRSRHAQRRRGRLADADDLVDCKEQRRRGLRGRLDAHRARGRGRQRGATDAPLAANEHAPDRRRRGGRQRSAGKRLRFRHKRRRARAERAGPAGRSRLGFAGGVHPP